MVVEVPALALCHVVLVVGISELLKEPPAPSLWQNGAPSVYHSVPRFFSRSIHPASSLKIQLFSEAQQPSMGPMA